jgi:acetyl esterase
MLDPQAALALQKLASHNAQAGPQPSPEQLRALYQSRRPFTEAPIPAVGISRDHRLSQGSETLTVREIRPAQASAQQVLPALLYLHGGGWMVGDIETHDVICRTLANAAGCTVISPDYRLAPEHPFPAAYDDTLATHAWMLAHAEQLRIAPDRIAVGGDSAGGNLAAAACLGLRGLPHAPVFQLLIYPVTGVRTDTASYQANGQGYGLTQAGMANYLAAYLGPAGPDGLTEPWRAAPMLAASLKGLPPALVLTAGFDPLRDDGQLYADALSSAGVPTQYVCFERQIHGFVAMGGLIDEAHTALALCGWALRRALG